jgi:hypothetical protein
MSTAALLLSLVALALAQDAPKTTPKPFKEPARPELAENALLARDEGCAKDLAKAAALGGIEQVKYLAELFKFGCVRMLPGRGPTQVAILDVRKIGSGASAVPIRKVLLQMPGGRLTCWALENGAISKPALNAALSSLPANAIHWIDNIEPWVEKPAAADAKK